MNFSTFICKQAQRILIHILIHFKSNTQYPETYMNPLHFHVGKQSSFGPLL
jgi:hypothetical protein